MLSHERRQQPALIMREADFLARLRELPLHPGAGGLADDAARLGSFVLTSDTLVEGVHFLSGDLPGDVAWKLLATNLSDLAAKGARPEGILLNYPLSNDAWDTAFLDGMGTALAHFACPLLGGDTVTLPTGAPRVLTITAIGADAAAPLRSGACAGDALWVTGTIGDAGVGLALAQGSRKVVADAGQNEAELLAAYRRPQPRLAEGRALGPLAHAMMDVSDGLLIDAARMAEASALAVEIDLALVPTSAAFDACCGRTQQALIDAATAGDDYELLFALPSGTDVPVAATRIGRFMTGRGMSLAHAGDPVDLPPSLGFQHGLR